MADLFFQHFEGTSSLKGIVDSLEHLRGKELREVG